MTENSTSTIDAPTCPAWCLEHIDGEHVGTVTTTIRASVPMDSWAAMDDQWRALYNHGAYLAWLRSTENPSFD